MTTQTQIVVVNVSQTFAPAPSTLQRTGALISQGGTTLPVNSLGLLTQLSDLTPILQGSVALSSLTWASNIVTGTTVAPHGWTNGDVIPAVIAGATPSGYNGSFSITITGASTFTYPLASNPGSETIPGTVTLSDVGQLQAMATTWFAQGANASVYVLELGEGTAIEGIASLTTWLTNNPLTVYAFLTPYGWDAQSTFVTLANNYAANNAMTYFYVSVTLSTYASFLNTKSVVMLIPNLTAPSTEFTCAALMQNRINLNPSTTNKVTPTCFQYVVGVTPYGPTPTQQVAFKTGNVNYVTTGAEGGISNTMIVWGVTADGNDVMYWYSIDWVQINLNLNISNEIINGSNNPINPLYYNQFGINRLQNRALATFNQGISYGMLLGTAVPVALPQSAFITNLNNGAYAGQVVVNAIPFPSYNSLNPSDYKLGVYNGLSAVLTPARGFINILFNVNVTQFVA